MAKPQWFRVQARGAESEAPEVYIYDEIGRGFFGGGLPADEFIAAVKALKLKATDELLVRINSPGGNVFDGAAIYNYLRGTKHPVRVRVDGVAASAASLIAMAGDPVEIPENAYLMIHNPWTMAVGDAGTLRKAAADLDVITEGFRAGYLRKANGKLSAEKLADLLDDETWLTATQAVELGLADTVFEPTRATALAHFEWSRLPFHRVPAALAEREATRPTEGFRAHLRSLGWTERSTK